MELHAGAVFFWNQKLDEKSGYQSRRKRDENQDEPTLFQYVEQIGQGYFTFHEYPPEQEAK